MIYIYITIIDPLEVSSNLSQWVLQLPTYGHSTAVHNMVNYLNMQHSHPLHKFIYYNINLNFVLCNVK